MRVVINIVLISFILCFYSCTKDIGYLKGNSSSITSVQVNGIAWTQLPNVTLTPTANFSIDIDADNVNDFTFVAGFYYASTGTHTITTDSATYISITGKQGQNLVGSTEYGQTSSYPPGLVDSGFVISQTAFPHFIKSCDFYKNSPQGNTCFNGNKYIPIVLNNVYYGWIKVEGFGLISKKIIIKEMAINKVANASIKAGQKQ